MQLGTPVNIGKWVLRNLFIGFIREEQRTRRKQSTSSHEHPNVQKPPANLQPESNGNMSRHRPSTDSTAPAQAAKLYTASLVISSAKMIPAVAPSPTSSAAPTTRSSPLLTPLIPIHPISKDTLPLPSIPQSPLGSNDATPMPRHTRAQTTEGGMPLSTPLATSKDDYFTMRVRPSTGTTASEDSAPQTPGAGLMGRLKSFGGKVGARKGSAEVVPPSPPVGRTSIPEAKAEVSSPSYSFRG
jgi:WD repeat-containing protein 48